MSRLSSSPTQKLELARRKMASRLETIRARVESDPGCGLSSLVTKAEMHLLHLRLSDCDALLIRIAGDLLERQAKTAAEAVAAAVKEQAALMAERGVETVRAKQGMTRDGWQWLLAKSGRIKSAQEVTGNAIRALYDRSVRDGLSSSGNESGVPANDEHDPIRQRVEALDQLRFIRAHVIEAVGASWPADLLEAVCGRGETLRSMAGDKDAAYVLEGQLRTALDMAGVALRLYRTTSRCIAA